METRINQHKTYFFETQQKIERHFFHELLSSPFFLTVFPGWISNLILEIAFNIKAGKVPASYDSIHTE
ncbi:hypothetical protein [Paenibacillus sp. USDA918EY]|uniref:hypothetical protein n=1 Tax=Paenibacillus sp. USDA918EY TaxID=2689575 RepID=UPI001F443209|nr:hypothetical protein [Paenibacillus sp. USDA918EY]